MFSYRSSDKIGFADPSSSTTRDVFQFSKSDDKSAAASKSSGYSPDGRLFAWISNEGLHVLDVDQNVTLQVFPVKKLVEFAFSPRATFVSTFERHSKVEDGAPQCMNVGIWDIGTGTKWANFSHKNPETWKIQWTEDESYFGRLVSNQVQFHDKRSPNIIASKLSLEGIAAFSISPGKNPCVAVFVPERKGLPGIVRLYGMLSFNYPLSNKTFFKADEAEFFWNQIGTNLLVLTRTITDKTGLSYYGETNLYYLSAVGNYDCRVGLDAVGPVHEIAWGPSGNEFVVVYGNVPAKAGLFDSRANKIFDFGASAKNFVRYSPKGRLILMAGFGNLAGYVEMWDRQNLIKLCSFKEDLAVFCEFLPDGTKILMATLSPRLRVDNRFRIRSYTGDILWQQDFKELYAVSIRPLSSQLKSLPTPEDSVVLKTIAAAPSSIQTKSAYVPPHLRQKMATSNGKPQTTTRTNISTAPIPNSNGGSETTMVSPIDKKISAISKKLKQISQLKERQSNGEQLEKNQLDKISGEEELLEQLKQLQLAPK